MTVKILKTYRGKHGLLVQGQVYDLTSGQIAAIAADCDDRKETFSYEKVKNAAAVNKEAATPKNKQQTGGKTK